MSWIDRARVSVESQWYTKPTWLWVFLPLVPVFIAVAAIRRWWLSRYAQSLPVPVIVVGNIAVGGTGKTPLLMALVKFLQTQGLRPGVVSRGYGGTSNLPTLVVDAATDPVLCGDEPALIAQMCSCPVVVGRNRVLAARRLIAEFACDLILSDDGLQHYALARDIEVLVLDGKRRLGNGWCFPLGPLRERATRLAQVDWVLTNGESPTSEASEASEVKVPDVRPQHSSFQLSARAWRSVQSQTLTPLTVYPWLQLQDTRSGSPAPKVFAIAGIGNPHRFFASLARLGIACEQRSFADHHAYQLEDFAFAEGNPVLMTSKDAVKCKIFARSNWWALEVEAELNPEFLSALWCQLQHLTNR